MMRIKDYIIPAVLEAVEAELDYRNKNVEEIAKESGWTKEDRNYFMNKNVYVKTGIVHNAVAKLMDKRVDYTTITRYMNKLANNSNYMSVVRGRQFRGGIYYKHYFAPSPINIARLRMEAESLSTLQEKQFKIYKKENKEFELKMFRFGTYRACRVIMDEKTVGIVEFDGSKKKPYKYKPYNSSFRARTFGSFDGFVKFAESHDLTNSE